MKVMNLVSLLVLPAVISMSDNSSRFVVAGIASFVILGAIWYSKSRPSGFDEPSDAIKAEVKV